MSAIELSIVIVSWNSRDVLCDCIQAIYDTVNVKFEIILVENNSSDNTVNYVHQAFPEVSILPQNENLGFSKGSNVGFYKSGGEYILFLNPDVILKKDVADKMLGFLKSRSDIGIIGPKVMKANGLPDFEYNRKLPRLYSDFLRIFLISRLINFAKKKLSVVNFFRDRIEKNDAISRECEFIEGSCMMLRRKTFGALKGFDETVEMYLDDIDICYKARGMGLKNYYLASSEIVHLKQHSTKKVANSKLYGIVGMKARLYYYRTHFGLISVIIYKTMVLLSIPYLLILDIASLPFYLLLGKTTQSLQLFNKHLRYFDILGG